MLLEISDLKVYFQTYLGMLKAVDGVKLQIEPGQALGLVGESGCGKSLTALSVMRLLPSTARIVQGQIIFCGRDLLELPEEDMRQIRGRAISMIFQEPASSLNPMMKIGSQIAEALVEHEAASRRQAKLKAMQMLERVGLPETCYDSYPHQLSGGMKQRAMIAMALICRPQLLIADEPTTALDVTVQAQVLGLLNELRDQLQMSLLLITHDLGIVAETCQKVAIMYAGQIVELAPASKLLERPCHPYTRGLLKSLLALAEPRQKIESIPGSVPNPADFPEGCRFRPRCALAEEICRLEPPLHQVDANHFAACHFARELSKMPTT
jgi:oligopeptide/dipeptide ABC transporter ATP-binding protein